MGLIRLMKKGVDTVDTVDEFHNLEPIEKMWWIKYKKIKTLWEEIYPETEFPGEIMDGPLITKPWKDPFHYLNDQLKKALSEIEKQFPDWERFQVENGLIFCNYDGVSVTCQDCRYRFKCEVKR